MQATKVNIGCGFDHRPGYLNVDMDPTCNPDILITDNNFTALPRQAFDELLAKDVLEHIKRAETPGALLEWADLLKIGGHMELETSSILGVAKVLTQRYNYADHAGFTICLFGNQAHDGDYHHTGFTDLTLKTQVLAAGFEIERIELRDEWLFWLRARKISSWTSLLDTAAAANDRDFVVAAYRYFLERDPEEIFLNLITGWLASGEKSRRDVLKHLATSQERLHSVAGKKLKNTPRVIHIPSDVLPKKRPLKSLMRWIKSAARQLVE